MIPAIITITFDNTDEMEFDFKSRNIKGFIIPPTTTLATSLDVYPSDYDISSSSAITTISGAGTYYKTFPAMKLSTIKLNAVLDGDVIFILE